MAHPWEAPAAARRIRDERFRDHSAILTDAGGNPLAGATAQLEQVTHDFLFGVAGFEIAPGIPDVPASGALPGLGGDGGAENAAFRDLYNRRIAELFNYVTLPFYWGRFEAGPNGPTQRERILAQADWCRARGIRTKGHPLFWHTVWPEWGQGWSPEEAMERNLRRIHREIADFAGRIDAWDVINEPCILPAFEFSPCPLIAYAQKHGRDAVVFAAMDAAREAAKTLDSRHRPELLINDYVVWDGEYERIIEKALDAGLQVDAIGIQSHMHTGYWEPERVWEVLESFACFGKPLHFTELTIISGPRKENQRFNGPAYDDWFTCPEEEARQAEQAEELYTLLFSHPMVSAVTWWTLSDRSTWLGAPAGSMRADGSAKPAYDVLHRLVKGDWWVSPRTVVADGEGRVAWRGCPGQYRLTVGGTSRVFHAGRNPDEKFAPFSEQTE